MIKLKKLKIRLIPILLLTLLLLPIFSTNSYAKLNDSFERVEGGFFIADEDLIILADYIQTLMAENAKLEQLVEVLEETLQLERKLLRPSVFDKLFWVLGGAGVGIIIILLVKLL